MALKQMKKSSFLEQKKFIETIIPKAVIQEGESGSYYLQLFYDLDIDPQDLIGPPKKGPSLSSESGHEGCVIPLNHSVRREGSESGAPSKKDQKPPLLPYGKLEDALWPFVKYGCGSWI